MQKLLVVFDQGWFSLSGNILIVLLCKAGQAASRE